MDSSRRKKSFLYISDSFLIQSWLWHRKQQWHFSRKILYEITLQAKLMAYSTLSQPISDTLALWGSLHLWNKASHGLPIQNGESLSSKPKATSHLTAMVLYSKTVLLYVCRLIIQPFPVLYIRHICPQTFQMYFPFHVNFWLRNSQHKNVFDLHFVHVTRNRLDFKSRHASYNSCNI